VRDDSREELLQQFSEFLDNNQKANIECAKDDTFSLYTELAGLKNEVQRESRQLHKVIEEFHAVFATLENSNKLLTRQLEDARKRESEIADNAAKPLLISVLDFQDRFVEAMRHKPVKKTLFGSNKHQKQWIEAQQDGMSMLLSRLEAISAQHGVKTLDCVGKPFDVKYMLAVDVEHDDNYEEGIVLAQVRPGFLLHGQSLRLAEVIVNRREQDSGVTCEQ